ncbi:TetR/AcrR family transcriptional regulator [Haematomicrobium sanguinis]|uniref:TetR/AcrR family transcriptional regulator n=1 Tax=Haematomicrobium sanguinis TaxID=479106 RepID=UPI00068B4A0F|nr:TetR/AcrR family transcriptional regulator [Haematomicrobium sanguinis]
MSPGFDPPKRSHRAFLPAQEFSNGEWNETYQGWIDGEAVAGESARERILRVASLAFYRWGIRAMTVDHVIALSKVSKMTFYRHFPSKFDLVEAVLEAWIAYSRQHVYACVRPPEKPALEALDELVDITVYEIARPFYNGSIILNVFREFPEDDHPVRRIIRAHYWWAVKVVEDLALRLQIERARRAAEQLLMVYESVCAAAAMRPALNARTQLRFMGGAMLVANRPELAEQMRAHDQARLARLRERRF